MSRSAPKRVRRPELLHSHDMYTWEKQQRAKAFAMLPVEGLKLSVLRETLKVFESEAELQWRFVKYWSREAVG
jgi:hypothetical protein